MDLKWALPGNGETDAGLELINCKIMTEMNLDAQ